MNQQRTFWVLGGDMRQAHLAQLLAADGHRVFTYALEHGAHAAPDAVSVRSLRALSEAGCVILPLPVCAEDGSLSSPLSDDTHPLCDILDHLSPEQVICGGRLDGGTRDLFVRRGLIIHDYFAREELVVANAVPTAEGAVQIAMEELPVTIHGLQVLIIGCGRVGKITAHRFSALGAHVTVAARRYEQLAWASALGFSTLLTQQLKDDPDRYGLIVNTVPATILDRDTLSGIRDDCLIIDLASKPGGVDMDTAAQLGRRVIWALSLPGKVAPVTAGSYIRDTVYNILRESGK